MPELNRHTSTLTDRECSTLFYGEMQDQLNVSIVTLSPGITISVPAGSSIEPVTSVVRSRIVDGSCWRMECDVHLFFSKDVDSTFTVCGWLNLV